jgi:murein DD-endopeptidase MepM/ murein hydrolase activator NlpD
MIIIYNLEKEPIMRKNLWKPFTLMLVPHSGEQVRSISISKVLLLSCTAGLLLTGAGGGYFLYKYQQYRKSTDQLHTYQVETEQIRKEYDTVSGSAEAVKQKLETLQQLENDLRAKNGLSPLPKEQQANNQGGVLQSRSGMTNPHMVLNADAIKSLETDVDQRMQSIEQTVKEVDQKHSQEIAAEMRKKDQEAHLPNVWPTDARTITSPFGYRVDPFTGSYALHTGIDIGGSEGSAIYTTADGTVETAGWNGGYGLSVLISHGNGLSTRYGHMSAVEVNAGQSVKKGSTIGRMGSTGRSTGTHLHYEVLVNGTFSDPIKYLP